MDEFPAVSRQVRDTFYSVSDDTLSLYVIGTDSHIAGRASPLIMNNAVPNL